MTLPVYYKDLISGHRTYTEEELGRKGVSLAHLVANGIPVPPFFILQSDVFKDIVSTIFQDTQVSSLEDFRNKVLSIPLPPQLISQIETEYQRISGFGKVWVAVRSSIIAPLYKELSFSGLLHTYLNIRGTSDIEKAIKDLYNSLFFDRTYDYIKKHNVSYSELSTAIVVQKMVQAEVSGIMYTYDPITMDKGHVSIEAVFGLGDVLTDGNVNPDIYTVSKSTLEIVEKKIVPQDWMKVRKVGDTESLEHLQKITISKMWQYSQKLDDDLIRELTELADRIEKALGGPQVIEWVMERGTIYILQAKSIEESSHAISNPLSQTTHKVTTMHDIDDFANAAAETPVTILSAPTQEEPPVQLPPETLLFSGTAASSGIAYGEAFVVPNAEAISDESLKELVEKITKKHIVITDEFTTTLESVFMKAGGIITNYGGVNSDAAMTARELRIPAVVGTRIATSFIQSGTPIKIDGSSGAVYRVDFIPEKLPERTEYDQQAADHVEKSFATQNKKIAEIPLNAMLHKSPDTVTKVFLNDSPFSAHAYLASAKQKLVKDDCNAIMIPVLTGDKQESLRIKRLKKNSLADIYLIISDTPSIDALLKTKRALAAQGIRRTKRVKILISIGSVYGLLNSANLADVAVDGFVYDAKALAASYMPGGTDIDSKLWNLLTENMEHIKKAKLSFLGLSLPGEYFTIPLRTELHQMLKKGINALIFPDVLPHALEQDIIDVQKGMVTVQLGA
jgi:phosphohistidine swiveling domain-containing protein